MGENQPLANEVAGGFSRVVYRGVVTRAISQ